MVVNISSDCMPKEEIMTLPKNQVFLPRTFAVLGTGIFKNNYLLEHALKTKIIRWYPSISKTKKEQVDAFIGWGKKKSYRRSQKKAIQLGLPVYSVEDGFLRSIDSGVDSKFAMSFVVDDLGIYFDVNKPSRLEQMILYRTTNDKDSWNSKLKNISDEMISSILDDNLSKYNNTEHCPILNELITPPNEVLTDNNSIHVLLIDQVLDDESVSAAGANKQTFRKMLLDACKNHPSACIWVKTHPANKSGYLTSLGIPENIRQRIYLINENVNSIKLLKQVNKVYTVSSHMGFEALMLQKQVFCYGASWYCGWGLTDDTNVPKNRLKKLIARRQSSSSYSLINEDTSNKSWVGVKSKLQASINTVKSMKLRSSFLEDHHKRIGNGVSATLQQLFYAAYIDYSHYVDPVTKKHCEIFDVINWLRTNRYWKNRLTADLTIYHISRWKLPFIKQFIPNNNQSIFICYKPNIIQKVLQTTPPVLHQNTAYVVWGTRQRKILEDHWYSQNTEIPNVYCMEDGFIRSNGLGASLLAPLSVVVDRQGIYYDAKQISDFESLMKNVEPLSERQKIRVDRLQEKLVTLKVSKYNVGQQLEQQRWLYDINKSTRLKILIVGQVEDDASIESCASEIVTNNQLIQQVRKSNPNAYLLYKPHPDVEAGLRTGKVKKKILKLVDAVAKETAIADCLKLVDCVHTISSLTGFEALLRGKEVYCYGLPFYAGWGLTKDVDANKDHQREYVLRRKTENPISLQQLIYITLFVYPLYRLPNGYGYAQVEQVVDFLYQNQNAISAKKSKSLLKGTSKHLTDNYVKSIKTEFMRLKHFINK